MSEQVRQGDPDQTYGMDAQHGESGTLNEGYGESEQMGEEQWSQVRYERQAQQVSGKALDNTRGDERDDDIDRMAGGMFPPEATPGNEANVETDAAQETPTDAANDEMPGAW